MKKLTAILILILIIKVLIMEKIVIKKPKNCPSFVNINLSFISRNTNKKYLKIWSQLSQKQWNLLKECKELYPEE